jgi:hypothetical protein
MLLILGLLRGLLVPWRGEGTRRLQCATLASDSPLGDERTQPLGPSTCCCCRRCTLVRTRLQAAWTSRTFAASLLKRLGCCNRLLLLLCLRSWRLLHILLPLLGAWLLQLHQFPLLCIGWLLVQQRLSLWCILPLALGRWGLQVGQRGGQLQAALVPVHK